jgi:hypothetical protein
VRQNIVLFTAQTGMPMVGFVTIPFFGKQMLVQGGGDSGAAGIADSVAIQVGVSSCIDCFAA